MRWNKHRDQVRCGSVQRSGCLDVHCLWSRQQVECSGGDRVLNVCGRFVYGGWNERYSHGMHDVCSRPLLRRYKLGGNMHWGYGQCCGGCRLPGVWERNEVFLGRCDHVQHVRHWIVHERWSRQSARHVHTVCSGQSMRWLQRRGRVRSRDVQRCGQRCVHGLCRRQKLQQCWRGCVLGVPRGIADRTDCGQDPQVRLHYLPKR